MRRQTILTENFHKLNMQDSRVKKGRHNRVVTSILESPERNEEASNTKDLPSNLEDSNLTGMLYATEDIDSKR